MAEKDAAKEQVEKLRETVQELDAACNRRSQQEMELRSCLGQVAVEWQQLAPYMDLIEPTIRKQYTEQVAAIQKRALKLITAINPKVKTVQEAIGTSIPLQGVSQTRSQTRRTPVKSKSKTFQDSPAPPREEGAGPSREDNGAHTSESSTSSTVTSENGEASGSQQNQSTLDKSAGSDLNATVRDQGSGSKKKKKKKKSTASSSSHESDVEGADNNHPDMNGEDKEEEAVAASDPPASEPSKEEESRKGKKASSKRKSASRRGGASSASTASSDSADDEDEDKAAAKRRKRKVKKKKSSRNKEEEGLFGTLPKSLFADKNTKTSSRKDLPRRNSLPVDRSLSASFRGRGSSVGSYVPDSFANRCQRSGDRRLYGPEFCSLEFPEHWQLPSLRDFEREYSRVDVVAMSVRPEAFGLFDGSEGSYYTWRSKFVRLVHVQKAHVIHKACALDQSVSARIREELFEGLETTHQDYLLRIRRLEHHFGGDDGQLDFMLRRIRELKDTRTDDAKKVKRAAYALEKCLAGPENPGDRHMMRMLRQNFTRTILKSYNTYRWDWNLPDTPQAVLDYLNRTVWVELDTAKDHKEREVSRFKSSRRAPKKKSKKDKKKKSKKSKKGKSKDNYLFLHAEDSDTSTDSSESSTSSSDSEDSSCESDEPRRGRFNAQKGSDQCGFCKGIHQIFKCIKFFCELNCEERREWVEQKEKCLLCFESGHDEDGCTVRRFCRFCGGRHNSTVHVKKKKKSKVEPKVQSTKDKKATKPAKKNKTKDKVESSESEEGVVHSVRTKAKSSTSLTTFVCQVRNPNTGQVEELNALADGGADHSVLSARAGKVLGLWTKDGGHKYSVKGHGGSSAVYDARSFRIQLLDPSGDQVRELRVKSYKEPCGDLQAENWRELRKNWPHLRKLDLPEPVGDGRVDFILGSSGLDLMEAICPVRFGPEGGPVAKLTRLGWVCGGRTIPNSSSEDSDSDDEGRLNFSSGGRSGLNGLRAEHQSELMLLKEQSRQREEHLRHNMKLLWGYGNSCCRSLLRNGDSPAVESALDSQARDQLASSYRELEDGSSEIGLLWKDRKRPKNNSKQALNIFLKSERRMKRHGALWFEFDQTVKDWVDKGYASMKEVDLEEQGFYIPTFMVVREDKLTTKFRLIVNGKFEFNGKCINDYLLSGPNVMNRLADVLIRFRYHKYVLTCDVSNMFLRVKVPEKDRRFLRFFFRDDEGKLRTVEMSSHAFGLTQSPFVVMESVNRRARELGESHPMGSQAIMRDSIVDDVLTGCKSFKGLSRLREELEDIYGTVNMSVHKWATNSPTLRQTIPSDKQAGAISLGHEADDLFCNELSDAPSVKCLGILWHPDKDLLQFFHETEETDQKGWTMRQISSRTSRLFDPLGLMSPLLLEGKLLMQSLWRLGLSWDDEVPAEVAEKYNKWLKKASKSHLSHIKRRVKGAFGSTEDRLIVFTDASSQAQAAAAYLYSSGEDRHEGCLWASKQKISSLNRCESISRLELEGAVLGVELARQICRAMQWDLGRVLYFTDSTTVLWWLRTYKELDVFVGNRVCRILDGSSVNQWFHVATKSNPADIPTRGMSGRKLVECSLWWEGPDFLRTPREDWPDQPEVVETRECCTGYRKEERRRVSGWLCVNRQAVESPRDGRTGWPDSFWCKIVLKHSDLEKGLRISTLVLKFLGMFRRFNWASNTELYKRYSQAAVLRMAQYEGLFEVLTSVLNNAKLPSKYLELNPGLDEVGVLRVRGRLQHADRLPYAARSPVLLSGRHEYSKRFLEQLHVRHLRHCGGKSTLMSESRWQAWITGLSGAAKAVLRSCVWCRRSSKAVAARMRTAPLHFTRIPLKQGCAFTEIGLDMAGPFHVKHGRTRAVGKRFILIFSCCWTRAISLEVIDSASTESCVMAFLRHSNCFGYPRYVNSDRGTNLVGLDRHFRDQWAVLESQFTKKSVDWPAVRWKFNPPYSPRFSGHVETMVKVTKSCLRKVLGQPKYLFRDEELQTLLKVVQGYANTRPLGKISNDPSDAPPIVPADFLMTGSRFLGGLPEMEFASYSLKTRKEMLGGVTKDLWNELVSGYILELQKTKGKSGEHNITVGSIVLLLDKTLPSGKYCLGKIESEVRNPDGRARSFMVRHNGEVVCRSIMALAPLELSLDETKQPETKASESEPTQMAPGVETAAEVPADQQVSLVEPTAVKKMPRREIAVKSDA